MNKKLSLYQITYHCLSCPQEYQTISLSTQKNIRIGSCGNCKYSIAASESKVGAVKKFRQRALKVKPNSEK